MLNRSHWCGASYPVEKPLSSKIPFDTQVELCGKGYRQADLRQGSWCAFQIVVSNKIWKVLLRGKQRGKRQANQRTRKVEKYTFTQTGTLILLWRRTPHSISSIPVFWRASIDSAISTISAGSQWRIFSFDGKDGVEWRCWDSRDKVRLKDRVALWGMGRWRSSNGQEEK